MNPIGAFGNLGLLGILGFGVFVTKTKQEALLERLDQAEAAYHAEQARLDRRRSSPHVAAAEAKRARRAAKLAGRCIE